MVRIVAALLLTLIFPACAITPPSSLFSSLNNDEREPVRQDPAPAPKRTQQAGIGSSIGGLWNSVKSGLSFGTEAKVTTPADEATTFDPEAAQNLINAYRAQKGLKPLRLNTQLASAAIKHSEDLAKSDRISHYGSDGSDAWERVRKTGYGARDRKSVV